MSTNLFGGWINIMTPVILRIRGIVVDASYFTGLIVLNFGPVNSYMQYIKKLNTCFY